LHFVNLTFLCSKRKIFVKDILVEITRVGKEFDNDDFDVIIDDNKEAEFRSENLIGDVLVKNASNIHIEQVFTMAREKKLSTLESITFAVADLEAAVHAIKERFSIIKAAGGIVSKEDKVLMIFRLKEWDLPKGKLDKKESVEEAALREIEEECSIKVKLDKKIVSTWHTYTQNGKRILKKTTWYRMTCINDGDMKPQIEEGIEDIRWMDRKQVRTALQNSYNSIREVFAQYYKPNVIDK